MRKPYAAVYLALITVLLCCLGGSAETVCEHQWAAYDMETDGVMQEEVELGEITDEYHMYMRYYPLAVCELCGARQPTQLGSGSYAPHAYTVTQWQWMEERAAAEISLSCGVCQHTYTYELTVQALLAGDGDNCLHGGACDLRQVGYKYENGMILSAGGELGVPFGFEKGERIWDASLIYDPAEKTFLFTSRSYCPVCGRPRTNNAFSPQTGFNPNWSGLPIMTMDYFMTKGVPENLPYQLIDHLRQEAAIAE